MKNRVFLGMSSGVDSTVAACLLKNQGFEVVSATMLLVPPEISPCAEQNAHEAAELASLLGIEHHILDLRREFKFHVISEFVNSYLSGKTPNPCVLCNEKIKFGEMVKIMSDFDCKYIATGHYAKCEYDSKTGNYLLKKVNHRKDQSYFLYSLSQSTLASVIFPLADFTKDEVRQIAKSKNLPVFSKRDSQDICFLENLTHSEFISKYSNKPYKKGNFISSDGKILGEHDGIIKYTVGQRKGLGIALGEPKYVSGINAVNNTVTLGSLDELMRDSLDVKRLHFISGAAPKSRFTADVKIRYAATPAKATIAVTGESTASVKFFEKQKSITPGQTAVFYDGDIVLGGGEII